MDEHPILVGYDGADGSGAALRWALSEAVRRAAPVRLVRVLDVPRRADPFAGRASSVEAHMLDEAKVALDKIGSEATAELSGTVTISTAALPGPVVGTLCDESDRASMIVLGSRGIGGFAGLLLGSVSVAVAAHARCPVVVVRENMTARPQGPVLVGVDDSEGARLAVEFAFAEAAAREAELVALCAGLPGTISAGEAVLDAALRRFRALYPTVPVTARALAGSPGQVLAGASPDAQLLVVGSRGRGGFHGLLLGSVSQQALHRAACPVAVVRRYNVTAPAAAGVGTPGTAR